MRQYLRLSLLTSGFLVFLISCKSYQIPDAQLVKNEKTSIENNYFSTLEDQVYKCQIEVYKNHISGIVMIKKLNDSTHRVAITSDFGNKMIDFEISENNFKLNSILPDLDKKIIINLLKNDFRILLKKDFSISETFDNKEFKIYTSEKSKEKFYLFVNREDNLLKKLVYTKNNREKMNFKFDAKKHIFADSVNLQHKDYKINIKLFQLTDTE
ncbi:hypothetical protein [Chryseobacterium sp.]|uniref:hypothetical protein n=1 Tax=Chryseobacterium sp. TaxID=1871047 RepID=UPI00388E5DFB